MSVINDTHRYEGGVVGHSDATSLFNHSVINMTNDGG